MQTKSGTRYEKASQKDGNGVPYRHAVNGVSYCIRRTSKITDTRSRRTVGRSVVCLPLGSATICVILSLPISSGCSRRRWILRSGVRCEWPTMHTVHSASWLTYWMRRSTSRGVRREYMRGYETPENHWSRELQPSTHNDLTVSSMAPCRHYDLSYDQSMHQDNTRAVTDNIGWCSTVVYISTQWWAVYRRNRDNDSSFVSELIFHWCVLMQRQQQQQL